MYKETINYLFHHVPSVTLPTPPKLWCVYSLVHVERHDTESPFSKEPSSPTVIEFTLNKNDEGGWISLSL